tara:strand:- start:114 stop:635 length:522 start_codon:yes stop_codon:yes gene_type:complete
MAFFEKDPYEIQATKPTGDNFNYYLSMQSLDGSVKKGGLKISSDNYVDFKEFLVQCKIKLNEWDSTAVANNIDELVKLIPVTYKPRLAGYFRYSDWHFDKSVKLTPKFYRTVGKSSLLITTGELTASDNEYIDCENLVFAFTSEEIDNLLEGLKPENIIKHFTAQDSKDELFK